MDTVRALIMLSQQCSHYEDGARWCDFCSHKLEVPPFAGHKEDCPVYEVRRALEDAEDSQTANNKPSEAQG